jgi:phospholipase A1
MSALASRFNIVAASAGLLLSLAAAAQEPAAVAPVPAAPLPKEIPVAPGDVPLKNPAPAPADAPSDSAGTTPPAGVSTPMAVAAPEPGLPPVLLTPQRVQTGCSLRDYGLAVERGQIAAAVFNTCSGFSLHKPVFLMPLTYSPRYDGRESEFIFQISAKAQLWDYGPGALYFGYSQKSFFQIYNSTKSKPFRETNFNPEVFTRLPRPLSFAPAWSVDVGAEHESNGNPLPDSRSYNRLYVAPFWTRGRQVVQVKAWYRLPEKQGRADTDPNRDDNPDLTDFTGYTELRYRRDFSYRHQLVDVMVRGNPSTGRGAIQVDYSLEIGPVGAAFLRVFNGYAESLIDYNRSVTRVGVGVALQR